MPLTSTIKQFLHPKKMNLLAMKTLLLDFVCCMMRFTFFHFPVILVAVLSMSSLFRQNGGWLSIVPSIKALDIPRKVAFKNVMMWMSCCLAVGTTCPLVLWCYSFKCIQKNFSHFSVLIVAVAGSHPYPTERSKLSGSFVSVEGEFRHWRQPKNVLSWS